MHKGQLLIYELARGVSPTIHAQVPRPCRWILAIPPFCLVLKASPGLAFTGPPSTTGAGEMCFHLCLMGVSEPGSVFSLRTRDQSGG